MSASKRAGHKVLRKVRSFIGPDISLPDSGEMASLIDAEYAPLIKAAQDVLLVHNADGCADPECDYCLLSKALAHIEGDATP